MATNTAPEGLSAAARETWDKMLAKAGANPRGAIALSAEEAADAKVLALVDEQGAVLSGTDLYLRFAEQVQGEQTSDGGPALTPKQKVA